MPETGKDRKARIELDYYHRPDVLAARRRRIVVGTVVLALAGLILAPSWRRGRAAPRLFQWQSLASHGELSRVHAAWDARCEACHPSWRPVDGSRWSPLHAGSRAADRLCQGCHAVSQHAEGEKAADVVACAECHRDHRGRDASLVRLEDSDCTRCHADLDRHRHPWTRADVATSVASFPGGHPEFRTPLDVNAKGESCDPGRIAFNHKLHLNLGKVVGVDGAEVSSRLDCAACHQPDAAGAYMRPISYDNHCQRCHPLGFEPGDPGRAVRHGVPPAEVVAELRQFYGAEAARGDSPLLRRPAPTRPMPGRVAATGPVAVDAKVLSAVRVLFGPTPSREPGDPPEDRRGCWLCHTPERLAAGPIDVGAIAKAEVAAPNMPSVWFGAARFDHAAHRRFDCAGCHAAKSSCSGADVLLPARESCASCHAPAGSDAQGQPTGGVGYACTDCHRYHHGEQPRTPARDATKFLSGAPAGR